MSEPVKFDRYCDPDEVWVCMACGKYREHDLYNFGDESCVLNARPITRKLLSINEHNRVIHVADSQDGTGVPV